MSNIAKQSARKRRHAKDSSRNRRVPSLRFHKASGQNYVVLSGKAIYCGKPEDADIRLVDGCTTWQDMREILNADGWDDVGTIVIDSVTKAEELAMAWVLANVPIDGNRRATRLEDYPYGKGYTHIYETFLSLLGDLDRHVRASRHVILIAHDCTTEVPNPAGANWLRYEPRLQSPSSGKNSVRLRVREWADP